jgi:hypothetical protein
MQILVFCTAPGMIRAGVRHQSFDAHLASEFSADQLRELIADPRFVVAVGQRLAADQVDDFFLKNTRAPEHAASADALEVGKQPGGVSGASEIGAGSASATSELGSDASLTYNPGERAGGASTATSADAAEGNAASADARGKRGAAKARR